MISLHNCLRRRAFLLQPSLQPSSCSTLSRQYSSTAESVSHNPQKSIWESLIPRSFRERKKTLSRPTKPRSKEWNPATFFIVIYLLIGSNAIQMIALKNDFRNFSRKADAKIGLLREVLERVQRGEDVDVKGLLGTGNEEQEKEWEEALVLREIEEDERMVESKPEKRARRAAKRASLSDSAAEELASVTQPEMSVNSEEKNADNDLVGGAADTGSTKTLKRPAFY